MNKNKIYDQWIQFVSDALARTPDAANKQSLDEMLSHVETKKATQTTINIPLGDM